MEDMTMVSLIDSITHPETALATDPNFPHAPLGWTKDAACNLAREEGLATMTDDHWEAVRALQEFHARHRNLGINVRELHDALDEKFHRQGGMRRLYVLFPKGPLAQGCHIAGLPVPPGALDRGIGSAM
jgi:TusE/DsrC/DsvC family sulfur relay protein